MHNALGNLVISVAVVLVLVGGALLPASPADAALDALPDRVELIPLGDTELSWGSGSFVGALEVVAVGGRLGLVESQTIDAYLSGLREVPASWPAAALQAQAVAARTFLAWSMERGRSGGGRTYGYDICATQACQVYRGSAIARSSEAAPWVAAVEQTSREVLLYNGSPAHTFYSSSAGTRTRPVQDIWGGGGAPYLIAVESPEAGVTPYEEWVVEMDGEAMSRIMAAAGIDVGAGITGAYVDSPSEGSGRSSVVLATAAGLTRLSVPSFRAIMNIHGPKLYPGLLPASRPDGRRWPQAVLSYTFDLDWTAGTDDLGPALIEWLPASDRPRRGTLRIIGEGWGHGVGMSQWGAKAMSDAGATYVEILGHYYGGLEPEQSAMADLVRIGLADDALAITIDASGAFEVRANGTSLGVVSGGEWTFRAVGGGIAVVAPEEFATGLGPAVLRRNWPR